METNNNLPSAPSNQTQVEVVDMTGIIDEVKSGVDENITSENHLTLLTNLPSYLSIGDEGVFLHIDKISGRVEFASFLDEFFSRGHYFTQTNYSDLTNLYFEESFYRENKGKTICLGKTISNLQEKRVLKLYKGITVGKTEVEFLFDKFVLMNEEEKIENYSFDELLAVLWGHGVKYGVLEKEVQTAIAASETQKIIVARNVLPTPGENAKINQVYEFVEKDFSPTLDENGKTNFAQLYNNIPQIDAGIEIFRKVPIQPGKDGKDIFGATLPQPALKDVDINKKRGEGTKVEILGGGEERIVSDIKGYIDLKGGKISITQHKKPHMGNIDAKTGNISIQQGNGDFTLMGNIDTEFELRGNDIFITGDVDGKVYSYGGKIQMKGTLSGSKDKKGNQTGYIFNENGEVEFLGGVLNEGVIVSPNGKIDLSKIRSVTGGRISGDTIDIHYARNTLIVGNNIKIHKAENCTIIGQNIQIEEMLSSRGSENSIYTVFKGDVPLLQSEIEQLEAEIITLGNQAIEKKKQFMEMQPSFKSLNLAYNNPTEFHKQIAKLLTPIRALTENVKNPNYVAALSQEQRVSVTRQLKLGQQLQKFATLFHETPQLIQEVNKKKAIKEAKEAEMNQLKADPSSCVISKVGGDTNIFSVIFQMDEQHFHMGKELLLSLFLDIKCLSKIDTESNEFGKCYTLST